MKILQPDGSHMFKLPSGLGAEVIHVVSVYKHLGSMVEMSGGLMADFRHRSSSAMASYSPIAGSIFSSPVISAKRKIALAFSLIVSKLVYNVHVWSSFGGKPRRQLNVVYMKVWRRIASKSRYAAGCGNDLLIRQILDVPSLDCLMRKNRLKYLSRLLVAGIPALDALLHSRGKLDTKLPWVELVLADMQLLYNTFPSIFASFSSPDLDSVVWVNAIRDYPQEWCNIVDRYHDHHDDTDVRNGRSCTKRRHSQINVTSVAVHSCTLCDDPPFVAETERGLLAHTRRKHGVRTPVAAFLADSSICPACGTDFHSRVRLLTHAADKRVRSITRGKSCYQQIMDMQLPRVPLGELERLQKQEREECRDAGRRGHSHPLAINPAKRTKPSVLKQQRSDYVRRRLVGKQPPPAAHSVRSLDCVQSKAKKPRIST